MKIWFSTALPLFTANPLSHFYISFLKKNEGDRGENMLAYGFTVHGATKMDGMV